MLNFTQHIDSENSIHAKVYQQTIEHRVTPAVAINLSAACSGVGQCASDVLLLGLTCTDDKVRTKTSGHRYAVERNYRDRYARYQPMWR